MRLTVFLDVPEASFTDAVAFWSAVTGWAVSPPRGDRRQFVTLLAPEGRSWLRLQAVGGEGAVHLDLDAADRQAAIRGSLALGALPAWHYHDVQVMRSPGGFVYCHTLDDGGTAASASGASVVDQVCLDVPGPLFEREVEFWQALTGRELHRSEVRPDFAFLAPTADDPVALLLQRLGEGEGVVRAHPDLHARDLPGEVARHVALGATVEREMAGWTTLRAPGGQVYCLVGRAASA